MREDTDDLPPKKRSDPGPGEGASFFGALGALFGMGLWLVLFFAIAGIGFYYLLRATH